MRRRARPIRLAAAAGLILAAALAAIVGTHSYSAAEPPAEPATLQRIARKNEAAATRAAAQMEAKSEQRAAASDALRDAEDEARDEARQ